MTEGSSHASASTERDHPWHVAIIGGGIAGLYCAYKLSKQNPNQRICVFEASGELGGRICTRTFPTGEKQYNRTEFFAEFGPMRIEPGHQKLLSRLLEDLEIRDERKTLDGLIKKHHADRGSEDAPELTHLQTVAQLKNTAHLIDFPQFSSPVEQDDPKYNLFEGGGK